MFEKERTHQQSPVEGEQAPPSSIVLIQVNANGVAVDRRAVLNPVLVAFEKVTEAVAFKTADEFEIETAELVGDTNNVVNIVRVTTVDTVVVD